MSHGQEHSTWSSDHVHLDIMARIAETSEQLNSAAEAGNWNLVRELISNEHNVVLAIQQSCLLQKFASLTKISYQLVKDILKQRFSSKESSQKLKVLATNAAVEAARCGNWDTLIVFLWSVEGLLEDDSSLRSVILTIADSQTLREKRYLHIDVLSAVWRNSKQTILDSTDKTVHNTLVQLAAKVNMWSRVCDLLVTMPDLNLLDRDGLSVLHRLVMCRDSRFDYLIKFLLDNGADTNLKTKDGDTALHLAAQHQKPTKLSSVPKSAYDKNRFDSYRHAIELLIGNKINETDKQENTSLMVGAHNENWEFVRILLEKGARADLVDKNKRSVLHIMALHGLPLSPGFLENLISLSLKRGSLIDDVDISGNAALHLAIQCQNWVVCKLLIQQGADATISDRNGYNTLHRLAETEDKYNNDVIPLLSLLKQKTGNHFDRWTLSGDPPLHLAGKKGNWTLVRHLVELGANIHALNKQGLNLLHVLATNKTFSSSDDESNENTVSSAIDFLLCAGITLDASCKRNDRPTRTDTALHLLARYDYWLVAKHLILRGAKTDKTDSDSISVKQRLIESKLETRKIEEVFILLFQEHRATTVAQSFRTQVKRDNKGSPIRHGAAGNKDLMLKLQRLLQMLESPTSFHIHRLIHLGAITRKIDFVKIVLQVVKVDKKDDDGYTLLHKLVQTCSPTIIDLISELVKEYGVNLEIKCPEGNNPLHIAARSGNYLAVKCLLQCGAKASALDKEGMTVLHRLLTQLYENMNTLNHPFPLDETSICIIAALPCAYPLISKRDGNGNTPLHLAMKYQQWNVALMLLGKGASMKEQDNEGYTALHRLASSKRLPRKDRMVSGCENCRAGNDSLPDVVKTLIINTERECIDILDPRKNTALHLSIKEKNWDIAECLLLKGANVHLRDTEDCSVLHKLASTKEKSDDGAGKDSRQRILKVLISRGANVKTRDSKGNTPIKVAAKHGNMDIVERLLEFHDNVNETDSEGYTLLSRVAQTSSPRCEDIARSLLKNGAEVNMCANNKTPLVLSVMAKNWPVSSILLNSGADIHTLCLEGLILHQLIDSVTHDNIIVILPLIVRVLEEDNDTVWHRSSDGRSVIQLAFMKRQWNIVDDLLSEEQRIEPEALVGENVYHYLADWAMHTDYPNHIVDLMKNIKLNINLPDDNGKTPVNILAKDNNWLCVKAFIEKGADVNMIDSEGVSLRQRLDMVDNKQDKDYLEVRDLVDMDQGNYEKSSVSKSLATYDSGGRVYQPESTSNETYILVGLFNAHSVMDWKRRKNIKKFILDYHVDITFLTETWLKKDGDEARDLAPEGYSLKFVPRSGERKGGGVGVLWLDRFSPFVDVETSFTIVHTSYELIQLTLKDPFPVYFFCIYRPCSIKTISSNNVIFLKEFEELLIFCSGLPGKVIFLGDFNYNYKEPSVCSTRSVISLLSKYRFEQSVSEATFKSSGSIIDWVLHRPEDIILHNCFVTHDLQSDHFSLLCSLNIPKPKRKRRESVRRIQQNL